MDILLTIVIGAAVLGSLALQSVVSIAEALAKRQPTA